MASVRDLVINIFGEDRTDRATRGVLRNIRRIKHALGTLGDIGGGIVDVLRVTGRRGGIALAVSLAATAAPLIVTMVAAAIQAGGVLGMIGLAAYLQRDNPALQAAVAKLKTTVATGLKDASAPLADDFVVAVNKMTASADRNMPLVAAAFKAVEPSITKLTDGLIGFVEGAAPGFVRMLEQSQPVIDVIAARLPVVGKALGSVFDTIGEGAPENARAMGDLLDLLAIFLLLIGSSIAISRTFYESSRAAFLGILRVVGQAMSLSLRAVELFITGTLRGLAKVASAVGADDLARKLRGAADSVEASGKAIRDEFARMQAQINALHGKTVTINVAIKKQQASGNPGYVKGINVPFATSSWSPTFAAAGGMGGHLAVTSGPVGVQVYIDGQETAARTIVNDSASRQAWRARTGRR
jgi:hypothetical protein